MIHKILLILLFSIFTIYSAESQHLQKSNFSPLNTYMENPAYINKDNNLALYLSGRNYWSSLDGSPTDLYFGINYPFMDNAAAGMRLAGDKQGIFNTVLSEFTYSYKQRINQEHTIYYGLSAGIETFRLNKNDIITGTLSDPVLDKKQYNETNFAAGIGFYYTYKDGFASLSFPHLLKHEKLLQTVRGSVGYKFVAYADSNSNILSFQPSIGVSSIPLSPLQFDISLITRIKEKIFVQTSYITNKSFITGFGINYKDVALGYSYEFNIGNLSHMSYGSHEIMLRYKIEGAKNVFKNLFKREREIKPAVKKPIKDTQKILEPEEEKIKDTIEFEEKKEKKDTITVKKDTSHIKTEEADKNIISQYQAKADKSYDIYYIIIGAYYELMDAVEFRDLIYRELGINAEIMQRQDGKYFFVFTDQIDEKENAIHRANELNNSKLRSYITGNVWIYGQDY